MQRECVCEGSDEIVSLILCKDILYLASPNVNLLLYHRTVIKTKKLLLTCSNKLKK